MRRTIRTKWVLLLLLLGVGPVSGMAENVDMFVGEVQVLGRVDVDRVAVGDGKVIRTEVLKSGELLIIALAKGSSSLRLWNKSGSQTGYNIRVSESDPEKRVRMESMIRMNVKLVEFRKSALGSLGINWAKDIQGPTFAAVGDWASSTLFRPPAVEGLGASVLPLSVKPFATYFGLSTLITSRINYLATSGDAMILAEPNLSCVNGGNAKFLAGGEVPYPVIGNDGQTDVEFKEYGIKLEIAPVANAAGDIFTNVMTEVSQLDKSVEVLGVPGLITRRTDTQINMRAGETIVISGLLSAENAKDVDKVAGLGDIPILGALFRSSDYRNNLSELVVFITPEVIRPTDAAVSKRESALYTESRERLRGIGDRLKYEIME